MNEFLLHTIKDTTEKVHLLSTALIFEDSIIIREADSKGYIGLWEISSNLCRLTREHSLVKGTISDFKSSEVSYCLESLYDNEYYVRRDSLEEILNVVKSLDIQCNFFCKTHNCSECSYAS